MLYFDYITSKLIFSANSYEYELPVDLAIQKLREEIDEILPELVCQKNIVFSADTTFLSGLVEREIQARAPQLKIIKPILGE